MNRVLLQTGNLLAAVRTSTAPLASKAGLSHTLICIPTAAVQAVPNSHSTRAAVLVRPQLSQGVASFCTKPTGKAAEVRMQSSIGGKDGSGGGRSGGGGSGGGGSGGGGSSRRGGLFGLWDAYLAALGTNPVLTKTITAAILNAVGDLISQLYFEDNDGIDWKRMATFAFLGFALVGPALHYWYLTLAKLIPSPGTQGALMRLAGDQLVFAPVFIAAFFSGLFLLEGHPKDIPAKLKQDWRGALVANWKLWVPFQFINFRFVPQQLQVLMANVVAVAWNSYLSWASHKKVAAA